MSTINTVFVERTDALNVCPSCEGTRIGADSFTGEIYCLGCGLILL